MVENFGADVFSQGYEIVYENRERAFDPENIEGLNEALYDIIPEED